MNLIFFGTSEFAVPSLLALAKSKHKVLAVITRPDKPAGRGMHLNMSPVKAAALKLNLTLYQPVSTAVQESVDFLKSKQADLFVVISYGEILEKRILEIPKKYCINLHGSLLPKYRGAAPCNWPVINNDKKTGVTIIKLNEKLDSGDIITSQSINISEDDTSQDVYNQLSVIGAETLLSTIDLIEAKKEKFIKQDDAQSTYAHKLKKQDGLINWSQSAEKIRNLIRGTQPWPGAYTCLGDKILKLYNADIIDEDSDMKPGTIVNIEKDAFVVCCAKGMLKVKEVQIEAKKRMSAEEFLRGAHIKVGQQF